MRTVQIGKDRTEGISAWVIGKKCVYISLYSLGQEPRLLILTALLLSASMCETPQQCSSSPPGASPCRSLYLLLLLATTPALAIQQIPKFPMVAGGLTEGQQHPILWNFCFFSTCSFQKQGNYTPRPHTQKYNRCK